MVAAGPHKIETCNALPAHDKDEIVFTAHCSECKQFYYHRISGMLLRHLNFDTPRAVAEQAKQFFAYVADQPCVGQGVISAVAQWLTDKLVAGPLDFHQAEYLWTREEEPWTVELVERVARELEFISPERPWEFRLPDEHPLANAA